MTFAAYGAITLFGLAFQLASAKCHHIPLRPSQGTEDTILTTTREHMGLDPSWRHTRRHNAIQFTRFRLVPFRSPLLGESAFAKATADKSGFIPNSAIT
jgi:hypothetical protein